jgi:peptidoglycan/xylan/chitin deacetylase (PgdA/CDA1 family)/CelD/BcsL family acetyltransferase involved in cellulose biosynthesis
MKVTEIRQEAEFQQLQSDWAHLCEAASKTIFLTWEWVTAWWSAYGSPGDLRIATVCDERGILRGIAPLRRKTLHRYGQTVSARSFIGDAPRDSDSDYLDLIIEPGYEKPVIQALLEHWAAAGRGEGVLELNEIPESSPNLAVLRELATDSDLIWTERDVPCAAVRLPHHWDEYLRLLQPRFRTKIRSVLTNLVGRSEVGFGFCETSDELDQMLPVLFDLHTRRWNHVGKSGVFGCNRKRDFYRKLSTVLLERGWLRFSSLKWNRRVLACQFGFVYKGTYFQLQEGYEPASEHWNVGAGLRAWSVQALIKDGVREYDFMGGIGRHKMDWGAEVKQSKRLLIAPKSYQSLVLLRGPEWEAAARASVRKLLPDKILAMRKMHFEPGHYAIGARGTRWLRHATAACYLYSGLPALTRRIRDRYQLSIGPAGKLSWEKRSQGAARIFYYHRVNNSNDPFFPAITNSHFEQQMRYLARYYRVLSMTQLIRHLQEGDSEPVVAITFDDGYADNYHNAFPILRRFALPATIFLTTGSLDSCEPLWFEQLAEAIKKTAREFLDVEIDAPRRLWMRTREERLASNQEIFDRLREVEDSERRLRLAEILRKLGPVTTGERTDKMLTWDQVRWMKANGIDFGGHTVSHPFLSRLSTASAAWEISECKRRIEQELQAPVEYFAYPSGREQDLGVTSKQILRSAGYRGAVTTIWGANYRATDPMELRRGGPWETNAALFAYKLDWYQLANA